MDRAASDFNAQAYTVKQEGAEDEDAELDEQMACQDTDRSVWMLKVPDFLYHRWARGAAAGDDRLGTLRMHPAKKPGEAGTFSILLPDELAQALPHAAAADGEDRTLLQAIPTEYEVMIHNEHSSNFYAFAENQPSAVGVSKKRKREPSLAGTVKHECNVKPTMNAEYKRIMQQRAERAAEPKRRMKMMDADLGTLNRMAAGVGNVDTAKGFKGFVKGKTRGGDKVVRLPRPEIEAAMFQMYDERAYWGVQELVVRLAQPLAYVKEVLGDIAQLVNAGPYKGQYGLKSAYKARAEQPDDAGPGEPSQAKAEEDDDDLLFDEVA